MVKVLCKIMIKLGESPLKLSAILCLFAVLSISVSAAKNPSDKRERALIHLSDLKSSKNSSAFNYYLQKVMRLYADHLKNLHATTDHQVEDQESILLLAEAENFHSLVQTGSLSNDALIEKLKQEHELMRLVEARLKAKFLKEQEALLTSVTLSTEGGGVTTGNRDHAPTQERWIAPANELDDFQDISLSIPLDVGKRHGFDKLNKDD
jgi:hypothetical protein